VVIEGMAEYLSVGADDPLTAMWIRDAARREKACPPSASSRARNTFPTATARRCGPTSPGATATRSSARCSARSGRGRATSRSC
jgi:hypothetical protein